MTIVEFYRATCSRCGQGINNVCRYKGKAYGTDCILHVTDNKELLNHIRSLRRKRNWNLDADEWLVQQQQQAEAEKIEQLERDRRRIAIAEENNWLTQVLEDDLAAHLVKTVEGVNFYSKNMDFIENMAAELRDRPFPQMSAKVKDILIDIYAKSYGRSNSKAYNKAYDAAYFKAYPDD